MACLRFVDITAPFHQFFGCCGIYNDEAVIECQIESSADGYIDHRRPHQPGRGRQFDRCLRGGVPADAGVNLGIYDTDHESIDEAGAA